MRGKSPRTSKSRISIPPIVLLPPAGKQPNCRRMPNPNLTSKFFEQLFEPGRPATALEPHYHSLASKLLVEAANFCRLTVVQLQPLYLSTFSCQITDRLLARMKVDPDIYCHRRLLLLTQIVLPVSLLTVGDACFMPSGLL
jgi:hypothetical protein